MGTSSHCGYSALGAHMWAAGPHLQYFLYQYITTVLYNTVNKLNSFYIN